MLFFRSRPISETSKVRPSSPEKLFTQVILEAQPQILKLWEEGDRFIKKDSLKCDSEIAFIKNVGRSYYQCQPHFWQCYWSGGVVENPSIKIDIFGQTFHLKAKQTFSPIKSYSDEKRYYQIVKGPIEGMNFHYGVMIELTLDGFPEMSWPMILTDSCRDVYLPQRIYNYGREEFLWDNFDRELFLDKFYVTNQQINEWRVLTGQYEKIIADRRKWPLPALLNLDEQNAYCSFWGKRVLEAKLFDAATMTPPDLKNPMPEKIKAPDTPWQRDIGKTFLGMARINPDYQLTPLDCQLAQVQGCREKYFTTDSVTWMGLNFALGFHPESLINNVEPQKNLKVSSRFESPSSLTHQLGLRDHWKGQQDDELPVAFRCYEEVSL